MEMSAHGAIAAFRSGGTISGSTWHPTSRIVVVQVSPPMPFGGRPVAFQFGGTPADTIGGGSEQHGIPKKSNQIWNRRNAARSLPGNAGFHMQHRDRRAMDRDRTARRRNRRPADLSAGRQHSVPGRENP